MDLQLKDQMKTNKEQIDTVNALRQVVADSYALLGETHLCHWNVRGPGFFALHTAFEEQYTELFTAIDELAERIRALQSFAPGGISRLAAMAGFEQIAEDASANDMVAHLSTHNKKLVENLVKAKDLAGKNGDTETEDLIIARIQIHEKHIWMLDSFLSE